MTTNESILLEIHKILCRCTNAEDAWAKACDWQYRHLSELCDISKTAKRISEEKLHEKSMESAFGPHGQG